MRFYCLLFLFLPVLASRGQEISAEEKSLADNEKDFAGLSKSKSTRDAFLAYLSDSTVMFDAGKPVIGRQGWIDRKPDSSLLFWWPVFVGLSRDGNLGFSTGPWEWSGNRQSKAQAFGYYATIWKKEKDGRWKMGVDAGISFPESEKTNPPLRASSPPAILQKENPAYAKQDLFALDDRYNSALRSSSFLAGFFSRDGHLLRAGHSSMSSPSNFSSLDERWHHFLFKTVDGGVAGSQDLGYTYGTVEITTKKDGRPAINKRCYLRVWTKEKEGWKIILDIIDGE